MNGQASNELASADSLTMLARSVLAEPQVLLFWRVVRTGVQDSAAACLMWLKGRGSAKGR